MIALRTRRVFQSLLALALCLVLLFDFGLFYLVPAAVAMLIAVSAGVYMLIAIAVGLVWPVVAVAFVLHTTSNVRSRAQTAHHRARRAPTAESDGLRVEDP